MLFPIQTNKTQLMPIISYNPLEIQSSKNLTSELGRGNSLLIKNNNGSLLNNIGSETFSKIMKQTNLDLFKFCKNILKKTPESRSVSDNKTLLRLVDQNKFLSDLVNNVSLDCFKNLMKHAKIQQIKQRQLLCDNSKLITHMVVVLDGKLGLCKHQQDEISLLIQCPNQNNQNLQSSKKPKNHHHKETKLKNKQKSKQPNGVHEKEKLKQKEKDTIQHQYLKQKQLHHQHMLQNIFDGLTEISVKQMQYLRNRNIIVNKKISLPITPSRRLDEGEFHKYEIEKEIGPGQEYGALARIVSKYHKNSVVTLTKAILMIIDMNMILVNLQAAFKAKLNQTVGKLKQISCFSFLEQQKLTECILCMRRQKKKRNEYLYKQGDKTDKIFILINGQIKLTKSAKLFEQNPNELYMDRRKLIHKKGDSGQKKLENAQKVGILPYANLTSLYNYRPMKKTIEIGIITCNMNGNFSLVGQEEMIEKRNRQTNAMVNSFDADFFDIDIKKLEEILGSQLTSFYILLEKSLRKVILYRQNEYAEKVINENKKNMNYFYYESNNKVKNSPRKYKIDKINNQLGLSPQRNQQINHAQGHNVNNEETQQKTKPFYTTFNLEKLMKSGQKKLKSQRKSQQIEKKNEQFPSTERKQRNLSQRVHGTSTQLRSREQHQDSLENLQIKYDPIQERLMSLSHSWKPMKKKVGQEMKVMEMISSKRHTINLLEPLIEQEYFTFVDKQQRRINREHKMFKLSLGKRTK